VKRVEEKRVEESEIEVRKPVPYQQLRECNADRPLDREKDALLTSSTR
jgi:hypothetical protein